MSELRNEPIKGLITLIVVIAAVWALYWAAMLYFVGDWQNRGLFGDMFGSVNALFSGAALAGVIYTIFLQRRELQLQRHELELTRNELQRTAEAQEKSEQALREQIKQMQEQSELQLMPFVVIANRPQTGYVLANVGNGTAIHIEVSMIEHQKDDIELIPCGTNVSFLNRGEEQHIDSVEFEGKEFRIVFSNINRKEYFIEGKFKSKKTEVERFGSI
jgi:hypothetical protein